MTLSDLRKLIDKHGADATLREVLDAEDAEAREKATRELHACLPSGLFGLPMPGNVERAFPCCGGRGCEVCDPLPWSKP